MNDLDQGRSETHRLALLALSRFVDERARMAGLFSLIHDPIDLQFGDVAALLEKSLAAAGKLPQPTTGRARRGLHLGALKQLVRSAAVFLWFQSIGRLRRQRVR